MSFSILYKVESFEATIQFNDTTCDDSIDTIARFLLGCGFDHSAVVSGLKKTAIRLEKGLIEPSIGHN
jgi:hypothetical protein